MRLAFAALIGISVLVTASSSLAGDLDDLQGTWKLVEAKASGRDVILESFALDSVVIKDKTLSLSKEGKAVTTVELSLNAAASPKKMTWTKKPHGSLPAIYELDGNQLRICFPLVPAGKPNEVETPESFDTTGKKLAVFTAERQ